MKYMKKYRLTALNAGWTLASVLVSATLVAAPAVARDNSQVAQARDTGQPRNAPPQTNTPSTSTGAGNMSPGGANIPPGSPPSVRSAPQSGNSATPASAQARTNVPGGSNTPPADSQAREILGASDSIRITVFQNPELTTETRVSQSGTIVFPLIGEVTLVGLTAAEAGSRIADKLKRGGYIINPQVSVAILQVRSRQVTVLGEFARPGNYVLEDSRSRLTDILTLAGGINSTGAETVRVLTNRGGKYEKHEINFPALFRGGDPSANIQLENGDTIYVERAPVFYIYGEVQRAGAYRLEPNTIVMQALSLGGGLTSRATERGIGINRRMPNGELMMIEAKLTDPIQADDIIYVRERLMEYRLREDSRDGPQAAGAR